jgi:hypothetical protein
MYDFEINSDSTDLNIELLILKIFARSSNSSACLGYNIEASSNEVIADSISPFLYSNIPFRMKAGAVDLGKLLK